MGSEKQALEKVYNTKRRTLGEPFVPSSGAKMSIWTRSLSILNHLLAMLS